MPAAVESVFEVAFWLADKALDENEYLQPQKLQQLLFLAQAYYAVANKGAKLAPLVFVAEEAGPIEPSIYKTFTKGRPNIEVNMFMGDELAVFLNSIWRRFGHHSTEYLAKMLKQCPAYRMASKRGRRAEIPLDAMRQSFELAHDAPGLDQVIRPKMLRSHKGRAVAVKSWDPRGLGAKK